MLQPDHLQIQTHHKKNSDNFFDEQRLLQINPKTNPKKLNKITLWNT
jgi:hypothetical protein